MKRIAITILLLLCSLILWANNLSFSGGKSSLSLREGKEEVILSEGAVVSFDSIQIRAERIVLSGDNWRYVACEGTTSIIDTSRGLDIRTLGLWFDRESESMMLQSWFELEDNSEELSAMGGSMYFDMKEEVLELNQQVTLQKITDNGIMRCSAETIIYNRNSKTLSLRSGATVNWRGDQYKAETISVDLETDSIKLEGKIEGSING